LRNNFVSGKEKYINQKAPNSTVFQAMDDPALNKLDPNGNFPDKKATRC
jgi:hypothetical protein